MKKFVSIIMVLATIFTIVAVSMVSVSAVSWPSTKNIKTYVISTGNDTTVYQTASSTSKYGTIYASDLITILGYSGSRFKVSYPVSGGTKTGYIDKSKVTSGTINYASAKWTATTSMTAYRRSSGSSTIGSVSKNDVCYSIAKSGSRTQIIYPISGGYKMGWVSTSSIPNNNNHKTTTSNTKLLFPLKGSIVRSSNTKTNGIYCDYKTGGSVPVYAPADGKVVYKQAYRNRNGKILSSYGNYIEFTTTINEVAYKVKCCHLSSFAGVSRTIKNSLSYPCSGSDGTLTLATKTVKQGDLLGYTGYTGNASGHHLHLEVYKGGQAVNPTSVFTTW